MSQGYQRVDGNGVNQLDDALEALVTEGVESAEAADHHGNL